MRIYKYMRKKAKKKTPTEKAKEKLWELCKQVVRKRDGDKCISCEKFGLVGSNQHTGHFIPSSTCGAYLRYYLKNLFVQCYNCNINLGGNGAYFTRELVKRYGQEYVDILFALKVEKAGMKADILFYNEKIAEFEGYLKLSKKQLQEITCKF
jgi:hypothetical protein